MFSYRGKGNLFAKKTVREQLWCELSGCGVRVTSNENSICQLRYGIESSSPGQTIATFQRNISQHCWANMLRAFGHPVALCCDIMQHLWMSHDVILVWPGSCNNVAPEFALYSVVRFSTPNMCITQYQGSQTHATCWAQQCCDMLHWNVEIFWPGLQILGQQCCDMLCYYVAIVWQGLHAYVLVILPFVHPLPYPLYWRLFSLWELTLKAGQTVMWLVSIHLGTVSV